MVKSKLTRAQLSKNISKARRIRRRLAKSRTGGLRQPVHFFTRSVYNPASITLNTATDTLQAFSFNLNMLPNVTEYTGLYDQYCIKGIKFKIIPRFNSVDPGVNQTPGGSTQPTDLNVNGQIYSVLDYDDSNAPTSIDYIMQYQNVKMTRLTDIHSRYFVPAVSTEVYRTGVTSAYAPRKNLWLDVANPDVPHYGIKIAIPAVANQVAYKFDIQMKFYLAFKNVR